MTNLWKISPILSKITNQNRNKYYTNNNNDIRRSDAQRCSKNKEQNIYSKNVDQ